MKEDITICPVCGQNRPGDFLQITDHFLSKETFTVVECSGCRFRWITPRPVATEIGGYYQSEEYISHDSAGGGWLTRLYRLARTVSIRGKYKIVDRWSGGKTLLDIGCGTGEFAAYVATKGYTVRGVEPGEKARQYATGTHGFPVAETLGEVAAERPRFGCITLWHVLEHLHDLNGSMEMIRSMIDPGGVVVVAVPNCDSWDARHFGTHWAAWDVPRHLYHFNAATLTMLAEKHGFAVKAVMPQKMDAYYVSLLSGKYRHGSASYLKAFFLGFWSNLKAGTGDRGHSSLIFLLVPEKS